MTYLQQFLGVVNFAGNFIKDLTKYRKNFRVLLKANERFVWKEIHTQRIRELKQVCKNLPKLVISQDDYEFIIYTEANQKQEKSHADTQVDSLHKLKRNLAYQ
ncbi:hypothetical protein ACS0TY_006706 [Phlomoides rotata]